MPQHFIVDKTDLAHTQLVDAEPLTPASGEVVLSIERFALTANNITYGVAGDMIGYWNFFPADDVWGRIPVWGIGVVRASEHPDIAVGTRFYGYFPMSTELRVQPEHVTERGFTDAAAHRADLPVVYNNYTVVNEANGFAPGYDNHAMLYRPLFTTSYVLDDFLADNDFFGTNHVILASASSKTAFGLAFMLRRRGGIKVSGLTSASNRGFVTNLGLYDNVLSYDEIEALPQEDSVFVDMAGNPDVRSRVHHHLGDQLKHSCGVGITHWESRDTTAPTDLPGAPPTMFFAPDQIVKRNRELGPAVYQRHLNDATEAFFAAVDAWVEIEEHPFSDVQSVYRTVLESAPPQRGFIVIG
jgi:hypothetical protein